MQIFLRKLSIFGLILFISACGFQLRGDIQANFDSISISGGTSGFNKTLQRKFRQAGITIASASEAEKIVEIIENKCEGMVRIKDVPGDYYFYDDKNKLNLKLVLYLILNNFLNYVSIF